MPPTAFGCRRRRSSAFETAMRAYRHLANETGSENGTDRQTDGRTDRSISLRSHRKAGSNVLAPNTLLLGCNIIIEVGYSTHL